MKDYGKILKSFYFEILGQNGERLREAQKKLMAFPTGAPGSYGIWYFDGVEYQGEENGIHTWTCYMKNYAHKQYVDFISGADDPRNVKLGMSPNMARRVRLKVDPVKDGVRKWRIDYGDHTLTIGGNSDIIATYDNRDYRWTMALRELHLDYSYEDLKFSEEHVNSIKTTPVDFVVNGEIQTGEGITVTTEQDAEITRETVLEYGFKETLAIGAEAEIKVKPPGGFVEVSASMRVDTSSEASKKNVVSSSVKYFTKESVTVTENSNVRIKAWVDWVDNGVVPFTATFNVGGTAKRTDGDFEADTLTSEEIQLILQDRGFSGQFISSKSDTSARGEIEGEMTGSFGLNKHLIVENVKK